MWIRCGKSRVIVRFDKDHLVLVEIYFLEGGGNEFLFSKEVFNPDLSLGRLELVNLFHDQGLFVFFPKISVYFTHGVSFC